MRCGQDLFSFLRSLSSPHRGVILPRQIKLPVLVNDTDNGTRPRRYSALKGIIYIIIL